jgi:Glycosyltransferase family 87
MWDLVSRSIARWNRPVAVGLIVSTIGAIPILTAWWTKIDPFPLIDFHNYESAARRLLEGGQLYAPWQSAPYPVTQISPSAGFAYAPPAAIYFVPFVGFPIAWVGFNLVAWVGTLIVVARRRPWVVELCLLLAIFSGSLLEALDYGQITPLVAASLGVAFWRPGMAGALACLSGLTKVSPAFMAWSDGRRGILRGSSSWLAIALLTLPIVGLDAWRQYGLALLNARPKCGSEVVSAVCALGDQLGPIVGWALAIAAILAAMTIPRYRALLFGIAIIVATPEIRLHYLLIPIMGLAVSMAAPEAASEPMATSSVGCA